MTLNALHRQEKNPLEQLYFNNCPYEHIVIPKASLHPKLQAHMTMIEKLRDMAKMRTLYDVLTIPELFLQYVSTAAMIQTLNVSRMLDIQKAIDPILNQYPKEDRKEMEKAFNMAMIPGCKYMPVNTATRLTTKLIQRIVNNQESPFENVDPGMALQDYHYGVIDNKMSLVLMKHPDATNSQELRGMAAFIRRFQWKQPFQRTRFALAKPEIREKSPSHELSVALQGSAA